MGKNHLGDCNNFFTMMRGFDKFLVQIMTPAYEGDPENPKVVPKDQWYQAPARPTGAPANDGQEIVNVTRHTCRVIRRRVQKAGFGAQLPSITLIMPDSTLRNPSISCWTKVQYTAAAPQC